jgi:hypothetical protein
VPAEKAKEQATRLLSRSETMQQAVNEPEDIGMVREFFASLSRSERLRIYDFFKSRIKFDEKAGHRLSARSGGNDGPKIDKEHKGETYPAPGNRGVK